MIESKNHNNDNAMLRKNIQNDCYYMKCKDDDSDDDDDDNDCNGCSFYGIQQFSDLTEIKDMCEFDDEESD